MSRLANVSLKDTTLNWCIGRYLPYHHFLLFADESSILASHKFYDKLFSMVNQKLDHVISWFTANNLALSVIKTNHIVVHIRSSIHGLDQTCRIVVDKICRQFSMSY